MCICVGFDDAFEGYVHPFFSVQTRRGEGGTLATTYWRLKLISDAFKVINFICFVYIVQFLLLFRTYTQTEGKK